MKLGQRVEFYDQVRQPHESANEFLAVLRKLACKCDFHGLDQALLDQFTRGQTDFKLKRKLIATKNTLQKAVEIVIAHDQTSWEDHQQRSLTATDCAPSVHQQQ